MSEARTPLEDFYNILTLPPIDWHIGPIVLAGVDLIGAEELVFPQLFQPMGQPAGHPRHGKERGKEINLDVHLVVDDARIEIDIGIDALPLE